MIERIALVALFATGLACTIRALPWPTRWLAKKPLACALCMAFHSTWVSILALWQMETVPRTGVEDAITLLVAATGLATFLCAQTGLFAAPLDLGGGE